MPRSFPCRMPCEGSCDSQNQRRMSENCWVLCSEFRWNKFGNHGEEQTLRTASLLGSYTTCTASVCPVCPLHTSSYVGFGVKPAAYPHAVVNTPGSRHAPFSEPQKHPFAKTACVMHRAALGRNTHAHGSAGTYPSRESRHARWHLLVLLREWRLHLVEKHVVLGAHRHLRCTTRQRSCTRHH